MLNIKAPKKGLSQKSKGQTPILEIPLTPFLLSKTGSTNEGGQTLNEKKSQLIFRKYDIGTEEVHAATSLITVRQSNELAGRDLDAPSSPKVVDRSAATDGF
uniref:Uncharacterized protein n=1 Tax=Cannabis sativa TaxID=3483 RepID=A0A803NSY1_CANSA